MENVCNGTHLDADVLLPPRKRLLAGLKKQSLEGESVPCPSISGSASTSSFADTSSEPIFSSSDFDIRLSNILSSSHPTNFNLTPEEIIEASRSAAVSAMEAAEAARATAAEKAAIAATAIAAARNALDLAASFSEDSGSKARNVKKSKLKKHLPVQLLYKKYQPMENCGRDEELAHKLHRAINSSPRISQSYSNSNLRNRRYSKRKGSTSYEIAGFARGGEELGRGHLSSYNGHEDTHQNMCSGRDKRTNRPEKSSQKVRGDGEAESDFSEEKSWEENDSVGKRRGRVKLKKLPWSIDATKDKAQSKEEVHSAIPPSSETESGNHPAADLPLFPVNPSADDPMAIEATSTCKSQEFKAPVCSNQNKVVQS